MQIDQCLSDGNVWQEACKESGFGYKRIKVRYS